MTDHPERTMADTVVHEQLMRRSVVMLLWNTGENDSRVLKEAMSLASGGYEVTIVCLAAPHLPDVETVGGVTYRRVFRALHPIRQRVDAAVRLASWTLLGIAGLLLAAPFLALGWALVSLEASPAVVAVASLALFLLGVAARSVIRPRTVLAKGRIFLSRRVLGSLRTTVLGWIYKMVSGQLAFKTMGDSVRVLAPDIIHAHDLQTLPAGAKLATELGTKLVYDTHELALEVSNPPRGLHRWRLRRKEREAIKIAGRVITVSEGIAERLERQYGIRRPVVVYNAPPVGAAGPPLRHVRGDLGLDASVPLALYVGAPSQHRGLEVLIDALGLLPEFHLACVGPRREEWETELFARASLSGSEGRLHFLDPVPIQELLAYLSTADVGVIAYQNICLNHEHCMPNKLFETVLAGVPIVVANLQDLRLFVEGHGVGRVADETDPVALADAMRIVSEDPSLKPTGEHLAELRSVFGWEAQGARMLDVYAELTHSLKVG